MFLESSVRRGTKYLYEIECFRGLAVVLVFGFHVWGISFGAKAESIITIGLCGGGTHGCHAVLCFKWVFIEFAVASLDQ